MMFRLNKWRWVIGIYILSFIISKAVSEMDKNLLEILACPLCKGELLFDASRQELICKFDRVAYLVVDDIPIMLEGRARRLGSEE